MNPKCLNINLERKNLFQSLLEVNMKPFLKDVFETFKPLITKSLFKRVISLNLILKRAKLNEKSIFFYGLFTSFLATRNEKRKFSFINYSKGSIIPMPLPGDSNGSMIPIPLFGDSNGSMMPMPLAGDSNGSIMPMPLAGDSNGSMIPIPLSVDAFTSACVVPKVSSNPARITIFLKIFMVV